MSMWIDTHAHLYLKQFDEDRQEVMDTCAQARVEKIFLPDIDSSTSAALWKMVEDFPDQVYGMSGLHPCSVKSDFRDQLDHVFSTAEEKPIIAIGEIGLDYYWDTSLVDQQKEAYQAQMQYALDHHWPIVIHSRDSLDDTISMAEAFAKKGLTGVFHCFNGTVDQMVRIEKMGFYMGLGGVITFKNAKLDDMVRTVNLERVILETDAPYLTPVPYRGKRNQSSYIPFIAEKVAACKGISVLEVEEVTTKNALELFSGAL